MKIQSVIPYHDAEKRSISKIPISREPTEFGQDNGIKADFVRLRKALDVAKKKRVEYSFAYSTYFVVEKNARGRRDR